MDNLIKNNILILTCNDIYRLYFSLWVELKNWRSTSAGFTGFSEFLIFRSLYHTIGQNFEPLKKGKSGTDPIIFRSENYKISQGVKLKVGNVNRFPDIYVKRNGKLVGITDIKIVTGGGKPQIDKSIATLKLFKESITQQLKDCLSLS